MVRRAYIRKVEDRLEGLEELGKVVDEAVERFRKTGTGDR